MPTSSASGNSARNSTNPAPWPQPASRIRAGGTRPRSRVFCASPRSAPRGVGNQGASRHARTGYRPTSASSKPNQAQAGRPNPGATSNIDSGKPSATISCRQRRCTAKLTAKLPTIEATAAHSAATPARCSSNQAAQAMPQHSKAGTGQRLATAHPSVIDPPRRWPKAWPLPTPVPAIEAAAQEQASLRQPTKTTRLRLRLLKTCFMCKLFLIRECSHALQGKENSPKASLKHRQEAISSRFSNPLNPHCPKG